MEIQDPRGHAAEVEVLRRELRAAEARVAARDAAIRDLNRRLRRQKDLERVLDTRTAQLAEKESLVSDLAQTIARRNRRLALLEPVESMGPA